MATRLYLPYNVTAAISPAVDAAWEKTSSTRYKASHLKLGTAAYEVSNYESVVTTPYDTAVVQFVAGPLQAQTIDGTVKGQMLARESDAAADLCRAMVIRVVTPLGVTRGTLLAHFPDPIASEFSATVPQNREFPPAATALAAVDALEGDYLVIEYGFRAFNASTTSYYGYLTIGAIWGTDLPEDEVEDELLNPWIEFSVDLLWRPAPDAYAGAGSISFGYPSGYTNVPTPVGAYASYYYYGAFLLSGTCVAVGSGETAPVIYEGAAAGSLRLFGSNDSEAIDPDDLTLTEMAGDGYLAFFGECPSDTLYYTTDEMAAAGDLWLMGLCTYETVIPITPEVFEGSGYIGIGEFCQAESIMPGGYELGVYAAAGSFILEGQCESADVALPIYECVAAGSIKLGAYQTAAAGTTYPDESITAFAARGGFDIIGSSIGEFSSGQVTAMAADTYLGANILLLSGQCAGGTLYPPVTSCLAVGGICFVNPDVDLQEIFETWVLTGQAYEPGIWTGFDFNSYCAYQGKVYGAGEDGIYLMEGSDDNGEKIHTGVRIGPHNYGTERKKRLRALRLGGQNNGTRVKVIAIDGEDEKEGYFDVVRGRVPVSRDLEGKEFTLDIIDFVELSQVEIVPLVLVKR